MADIKDPNPSSPSLKLFGSWASPYTHRIQLALNLKKLSYDYIEEDLTSKSPSLILLNPVYKKVPVLLAAGIPVSESLLILHFLDEFFPDAAYKLLPPSPHGRAAARFWANFADDRLSPAVAAVFATSGDAQQAAIERFKAELRILEGELAGGVFAGMRFFGGDSIGFLDIVIGCGSYWLAAFEEVAMAKLVDAGEFPRFHAWLRDFEEEEKVREIIPPFEKLLGYARGMREMMLTVNGGVAGGDGGGGVVSPV